MNRVRRNVQGHAWRGCCGPPAESRARHRRRPSTRQAASRGTAAMGATTAPRARWRVRRWSMSFNFSIARPRGVKRAVGRRC